jgi:phosphoglycolate phosphatase-like HAD superfamily hydrolase
VSDTPRVLALDFDGVLCDGRPEYFETARRAYAAAWPGADVRRAASVADRFAAARPLVESGWEMPVLLHALVSGVPEESLVDRRAWQSTAARLLAEAGAEPERLARALNEARDAWFGRDPDSWLRHHRFYPGVCARVQRAVEAGVTVVVVTTKAERFARALLAAEHRRLASLPVIGREPDRTVPKADSLVRLAAVHGLPPGAARLWFVEDLLETLLAVRVTAGLGAARLFLAAWGYNTLEQRAAAGWTAHVALLSLADMAAPFAAWPGSGS